MATAPGKYDNWGRTVREGTGAHGVVVIVLNGIRGTGYSVQAIDERSKPVLADLLQHVVDQMRSTEA